MNESEKNPDIVELDADALAYYMEELAKALRQVQGDNAEQLAHLQTGMQQIADRMAQLQESVRAGIDDNTKTNVAAIELAQQNYKTALHRMQFRPSEREDIGKKIGELQREVTQWKHAVKTWQTGDEVERKLDKVLGELATTKDNTNAQFLASVMALLIAVGLFIKVWFF